MGEQTNLILNKTTGRLLTLESNGEAYVSSKISNVIPSTYQQTLYTAIISILPAAGGSSISGPTEDTKIGGEDEYTTLCNLKEDLSGR